MKHDKTVIHFTDKNKSYRVEYDYSNTADRNVLVEKESNAYVSNQWDIEELQARVYENENCIRLFDSMPYTKSKNPTKSQAKELISMALKEKKQIKVKNV